MKSLFMFFVLAFLSFSAVGAQEQGGGEAAAAEQGGVFDRVVSIFSLESMMRLILALVICIAGFIVARILTSRAKTKVRQHLHGDEQHRDKITSLLGSILATIIFVFFLFIGLTIMGIQFDFFLGGLSVGLGFALREVIQNFIAGVFVLTTKEFRIGDIATIEGAKYNFIGRIEEINLRYTVMRTFDMRRVVLPNMDLISNPIKTFTAETIVRLHLDITVANNVTIEDIEKPIVNAVQDYENIVKPEATRLILMGFSESGMMLRIYFYAEASFESAIGYISSDMYILVKKACDAHNISISYPHMALTVDDDDKSLLKQAVALAQVQHKMQQKLHQRSQSSSTGIS